MAASTARKTSRKTTPRKSPGRKSASSKPASGKTAPRKTAARKTAAKSAARKTPRTSPSSSSGQSAKRSAPKRWSQRVTDSSDALDLKQGVFKLSDPKKIAASLKRSAERSDRRKTGAYRSALSMLTFYINRAGKNLPQTQRDRLQRAKDELKRQFGRA
uniref:DUF3175 domain-containing protein n=1 Tax=Rhodopseudomonas palustris (strain BisA53) TaxID=316055 RepID=Q07HW4_RHOP5